MKLPSSDSTLDRFDAESAATRGNDDQATRLRALIASVEKNAPTEAPSDDPLAATSQRPLPPMIAFASGKGGVGKTNICLSVATILAERGIRVTVVDGDLGMANADVLCGVRPRGHLGHVIAGVKSLDDITLRTSGGFDLVPGGSGIARLADLTAHERAILFRSLNRMQSNSELLLVDCGAGIGPKVQMFIDAADLTLVVTTPEPTSITDAYSLIKCVVARRDRAATECAEPVSGDLAVLVNMAYDEREAIAIQTRIASVARKFLATDLASAGFVRRDRAVFNAVRARKPYAVLDPKALATRDTQAVGEFIAKLTLSPQRLERRRRGLRRLLRRN